MRRLAFVLWMFALHAGFGQSSIDTVATPMTLTQFYAMVYKHHPDMRLAEIAREKGDLKVSEARGGFDPKLKSDFSTKEFSGSDYYDVWSTELSMPMPLSLDLKAGYERNQGLFLNPQNNVPNDGLYALGVSLPLGRGLLNNPRNLALKRAGILNKQGEIEANDKRNRIGNGMKLMRKPVYYNRRYRYRSSAWRP